MRSPRPGSRVPGVLVLVAVTGAGCGAAPRDEDSINASVAPAPACAAIEERRRLGSEPPQLDFPLTRSDVDDFSGTTADACNLRSMVYMSGPDGRGLILRFAFSADARPAFRLAGGTAEGSGPAGSIPIRGPNGVRGARFATGSAVVDVFPACDVPADPLSSTGSCAAMRSEAARDRLRDVVLEVRRRG